MKKDIRGLQERLAKRQDKIQRLTANIEKLQKKLEKIEVTEYEDESWKRFDIRHTAGEIEDKEQKIDQLLEEVEKIRAEIAEYEAWKNKNRDVKVIWDFLEMWKEHERNWYESVRKHYIGGIEYAKAQKGQANELEDKAEKLVGNVPWFQRKKALDENPEASALMEEAEALRNEVAMFFSMTAPVMPYLTEDNEMDTEKLEKDLSYSAVLMYDRLLEQIEKITGTIEDATGLGIGAKGEINGIVSGKAGNAKVQTIGAGGHNIQRYHFRTLVHEVK